jgi:hypothetical protein
MANMLGPGWNRPNDAVYPLSLNDANGDEYNGAEHKYVIHFDKGRLPPATATTASWRGSDPTTSCPTYAPLSRRLGDQAIHTYTA